MCSETHMRANKCPLACSSESHHIYLAYISKFDNDTLLTNHSSLIMTLRGAILPKGKTRSTVSVFLSSRHPQKKEQNYYRAGCFRFRGLRVSRPARSHRTQNALLYWIPPLLAPPPCCTQLGFSRCIRTWKY